MENLTRVFTAAEVRRPVNVGDPAQVYVDGAYAGLLDPRGRTASDRDNVVRLLAYLHSTGARKAKIKAAIEGYPNGGVDVTLMWDTDDDGVPLLDDKASSGRGCGGGAALVALPTASGSRTTASARSRGILQLRFPKLENPSRSH